MVSLGTYTSGMDGTCCNLIRAPVQAVLAWWDQLRCLAIMETDLPPPLSIASGRSPDNADTNSECPSMSKKDSSEADSDDIIGKQSKVVA